MAFIFANLVCGIWVILLAVTTTVDDTSPDAVMLTVLVVLGAPVAYAIPYWLVRLIGVVVVAVKTRRQD